VDATTGKLKWYYQFSPHDERDYDSVQVPVLADMPWKGKPRKVMLWANRNGMFYILDRVTGEFLLAKAFVKQNWNVGFDPKGRPIPAPGTTPKPIGLSYIEPGTQGGTNWYPPSYSPHTGLMYVSTWANYAQYSPKSTVLEKFELNKRYQGTGVTDAQRAAVGDKARRVPSAYRKEGEGYGALRALDPQTGEKKWDFKMANYTESGVLSTASDLVFAGGMDGNFFALNARNGECLWKVALGGTVAGGPITYSVKGRQYVAVAAEGALYAFSLPD
jgi:alcohol dehydrogenase (cytochrome c)